MIVTGILQGNTPVIIVSWLFGIVGILANLYVIYTSVQNTHFSGTFTNRFHNVYNFLIANLAITDLFGCVYLFIIAIADAYYKNNHPYLFGCLFTNSCHNLTNIWTRTPLCSIARFLSTITTITPAIIALYIAIDRYFKVVKYRSVNPLTIRRCKILVTVAWAFSIVLASIITIRSRYLYEPHNFKNFNNVCCFSNANDTIFRMVSFTGFTAVIGSYTISIALYLSILKRVRKTRHQVVNILDTSNRNSNIVEIRLCVITGILTVTNLCSWLPSLSILAAKAIYTSNSVLTSTIWYHGFLLIFYLVFINSCANPIIYITFLIKNFERSGSLFTTSK